MRPHHPVFRLPTETYRSTTKVEPIFWVTTYLALISASTVVSLGYGHDTSMPEKVFFIKKRYSFSPALTLPYQIVDLGAFRHPVTTGILSICVFSNSSLIKDLRR